MSCVGDGAPVVASRRQRRGAASAGALVCCLCFRVLGGQLLQSRGPEPAFLSHAPGSAVAGGDAASAVGAPRPAAAHGGPAPLPSPRRVGSASPPVPWVLGLAAAAVALAAARRRVPAAAATRRTAPASAPAGGPKEALQAFWKFLRPHTIRGTILGSSAMVSRVVLEHGKPPDWSLLPLAACGVLALLCGNGFIVGINQIYDVSIDVINKPFLPVASRELSIPRAWFLTVAMAVVGTALATQLFGSLIGGLYVMGLSLGTLYSVPPFRLKQSAIAAALIIAVCRGFLLNFGVYYATRAMLGVSFSWSYPTAFITCFCTVFALVIAVTKDMPDVEGDLENGIETFATRFGVGRVASMATGALLANYAASLFWAFGPFGAAFRPAVLLPAQGVLALLLVRGHARLRNAKYSKDAILAFYRLIWTLFYSQYALFPFI